MAFELLVLRLIHVVGGMFWVGAGLFSGIFLMPALTEAGPAAGAVMGSMKRRRLFVVMPAVAILTILSGLRLMWITSGGFAPGYFATASGATFAAAGGAAILAFLLGLLVSMPAGRRMGELGAAIGKAADPEEAARLSGELARVQRRVRLVGSAVMVLLLAAAAGMAVGRYVH